MELAPNSEPWTAAVAWARPWHRPPLRRTALVTACGVRPPTAPGVTDAEPAREAAWAEALAELRIAREALARLDPAVDDVWTEALVRQDLFLARRRLRQAQEALTGGDADLHWSAP